MRTIIPIALLVVVALLVFIQMRPDRFHIERSAMINAPGSAILPHINDFHAWPAWSPFEKIDPQLWPRPAPPSTSDPRTCSGATASPSSRIRSGTAGC